MGPAWRTSVVVIVLTLAPMQAWAECAWVLWLNTEVISAAIPTDWTVAQAFSARQECLNGLRKTFNQIKGATTTNIDQIAAGSFMVITADRQASTAGKCLPDTIDPRGPKGGGR
jgi:hypothetical protein